VLRRDTIFLAPFFTHFNTGLLSWWVSTNATVIANFRHNILEEKEPMEDYEPQMILVAAWETWEEEESGNVSLGED